MSRIIVLGAGGNAGRATVTEALRRGHEVTAFLRDPAKAPEGATVVQGDATDPAAVAAAVAGHDVAVTSLYSAEAEPAAFYAAAATAIIASRVPRVVHISLATLMETDGPRLLDAPDFPESLQGFDVRAFNLGHAEALTRLKASGIDWTAVSPTTDFDREAAPTGTYRVASHADLGVATFADFSTGVGRITYADFAVGILDEIEDPRHRRAHFGLAGK